MERRSLMSDSAHPNDEPRSIAADALSRGQWALARSFRMHRPRGAFCLEGWCQQCRTTLEDGRVVLACQTAVGQARLAAIPRRGLVGRIAERLPPWFYEHRFLRPRFLRQWYLARLRGLSAAPNFPLGSPSRSGRYEELDCDCLVIGGGLSGLEAAAELAKEGNRVTLVEADRLGGRARFSATRQTRARDLARLIAQSVACHEKTLCVALYRSPSRALCVTDDGTMLIRFDRIVVATGAYDQLPLVPGNDLPGIFGVRAFERLVHDAALPRATRIGIYGDCAEVERALQCAGAHGLAVAWIAGPGELPATSVVAHAQRTLSCIRGWNRVRSAILEHGEALPCDLLVAAHSRPARELEAQWRDVTQLDARDEAATSDQVLLGADAATGARETFTHQTAAGAHNDHTARVASAALSDDAMVCLCEDVRVWHVRRAIADGYRDVELVKRHTGIGTGPCQGKLCHGGLLQCLREAGLAERLPTPRPFVRPMPLALFAGRSDA